MKRLLSAILASALLLTACGSAGAPSSEAPPVSPESTASASESSSTPASTDGITLTMFQSKVEIVDQLEALSKEYSEKNNVNFEVWGASADSYRSQLQGYMASGQGPVMFSLGGEIQLEQFSQYAADLSSQAYVEHISPGLALEKDGKIFGVPYGIEGYGLVINKNLIDPATDLQSFDTMSTMFDRLNGEGVAPLLISSERYFLIVHLLNMPMALQPDYRAFVEQLNNGEVKMADIAEFQELGKLMELIREKSTNPLEVTYDKQIAAFADGEAASIHQGNWAYGMFSTYDVPFEMTLAPLPISNNQKIPVGVASYWCVNSQATAEQQAAAHDFYNYLLNSEEGHKILIDDFGFIPPFSNAAYTTDDPLSKVVFDYASEGNSLPWSFNLWPQGIIETLIAPTAEAFFSDPSMDGAAFLAALDEGWETAANEVK